MVWSFLQPLIHDFGVIACLFVLLFYFKILYAQNYWKRRNVPFIPPVPIFGSIFGMAFGLESITVSQMKSYNTFKGHRFAGIYVMTRPHLVIRDPKLIKSVLIKDFASFRDRGISVDSKISPLVESVLHSDGRQWIDLRSKISTVFSVNKVKNMHCRIVACGDKMVELLDQQAKIHRSIDVHEFFSLFTISIIGACVFGIDEHLWADPNSQFHKRCRDVIKPTWRSQLRFALRILSPNLIKTFKLSSVRRSVRSYFIELVHQKMAEREQTSHSGTDFIQTFKKLKSFTDGQNSFLKTDDFHDAVVTASALVFLLAGFETTTCTLSYCLFEIAKNEEIQDKLYSEIKEAVGSSTTVHTDVLSKLTYLGQVISETMRMYPAVPIILRKSTQEYQIPNSNLTLPKGARVDIPVYAIHHDPDIYENPEEFNPDRFTEENMEKITSGTYLPFGCGPRICIGIHFALDQMKTILVQLLLRYRVKIGPETPSKLSFRTSSTLLLIPETKIWLEFEKRKE